FANPCIKHFLLSIALNSTSKFKARVLPTIKDYIKRNNGKLPPRLTFSLAALIAFYRGTELNGNTLIGHRDGQEYKIHDDIAALETMKSVWSQYDDTPAGAGAGAGAEKVARGVLGSAKLWGEDLNALPGFTAAVTKNLQNI